MSELKPCPWCGHIDIEMHELGMACMQMACENCGATGPVAPTPDDAYTAWNTRTGDEK